MTSAQSTTRSSHYFQQIRKSWRDRTSSVSWAISTAFFTSVTCTVLAAVAMALNWQVPSVYLKVFLIAFVVRKWIVTLKMMDRALYRLPLNLTEPDPDIDEERHNGVAIYMSQLFTWHGYAMLLCGQLFIFFYASGHYLMEYPIVAGVAIAFSCMGLVPFFALLSLLLFIIMFLYFSYLVMYLILWPFSYWGLVQRRAISRRNGGYQSEGTTNSTDLNQVARSLEDAENGRGGGGGFGATERLKLTPAMMAIPIVIYKKPDARPVMTLPSAAMAAAAHTTTNSGPQQQQQRRPSQTGDNNNGITNTTTTMTRSNEVAGTDGPFNTSPRRNRTNSTHPVGNLPVVLAMPQPHPGNNSISNSIGGDSQNDALNMMSSNLSALCNAPPFPSSRSRSPSSTSSMLSSDMSFIRCASGQQMSEVEARLRPVALKPPSIRIPSPSSATVPSEALYPACLATAIFPDSHRRNYSAGQSSNNTSHSYTQHQEVLSTDEPTATIATPITPAIASLPPPPSIGAPVSTTSKSISSSISFSPSSSRSGSRSGSGAASMADIDEHEPNHSHGREFGQGDEECAICLCDFEDGDVLRHLYCDHMFHKNCVDRWLVKNAFCPKCKRGI
ncbi:hypothetical protein BGX23_006668 [Mortierella sp. AD031]|nr:hypothetical protein BGX23_006668 [Mortierella sp. AD031]